MRVISFGDSFTAGLGTNRKVEEKFYKGVPKHRLPEARAKHRKYIVERSFTKYLADKLKCTYINEGAIGCNNNDIVNSIVRFGLEKKFNKDDLVVVSFTSTLRDKLPFLPSQINDQHRPGITWSIKELSLLENFDATLIEFISDENNFKIANKDGYANKEELLAYGKFNYTYHEFCKKYVIDMHDYSYLDYFNLNMIAFLQIYFNVNNVKYIFADAFEHSYNGSCYDKVDKLDLRNYFEFGKNTYSTILTSMNDRTLLEDDGYNINNLVSLHPSYKGHKVIANLLHKFYQSVYEN